MQSLQLLLPLELPRLVFPERSPLNQPPPCLFLPRLQLFLLALRFALGFALGK
jgi:hypothetical protein